MCLISVPQTWLAISVLLLKHFDFGIGKQDFIHSKNPVRLHVGQCITFTARPSYSVVGNWTWRKDTRPLTTSSRVVQDGNYLHIYDVTASDGAYYSTSVQTVERKELFQFWLAVQECGDNEKKSPYFQGKCKSWCQKKCDVGWKYYKEGCYKYFATPKTWENALDSCRSKGAKLTVVESEEENEFVSSLLESGEGAWIGLNDRYSESKYTWNNDADATVHYFSWAKSEPSNTNEDCNIENCVEMKYGSLKWNDMICNGYNAFVCQLEMRNFNVSSSWSCFSQRCYKYFSDEVIWKDAKERCQYTGGRLVSIENPDVLKFVGNLIARNIWIALNDIAESGKYVWFDSDVGKLSNKASYFNWDNGEPNDNIHQKRGSDKLCPGEDCVRINRWNNKVAWYDSKCSRKYPYVCEKVLDSFLILAAIIGISIGSTAVLIVIIAICQFRLRHYWNKVHVKKMVFN